MGSPQKESSSHHAKVASRTQRTLILLPGPHASLPMLWLMAFHVIFVVTWFAGLFYLPRLFIYHVEATEPVLRERFQVMERRLMAITHIGGALTVIFGLALVGWWSTHAP